MELHRDISNFGMTCVDLVILVLLVMTKDYFRMEWDCDALDYPNKHKVSKTSTTHMH